MNIIELETPKKTEKHISPKINGTHPLTVTEYGRTYKNVPCYQIRMDSPVSCIQYVLSGEGVIVCDDGIFTVRKGDTFFLHEGENQIYYSGADNNFERVWINFNGAMGIALAGLYGLSDSKIFSGVNTRPLLEEAVDALSKITDPDVYCRECERRVFLILQFLSQYKARKAQPSSSGEKIRLYLDRNIMRSISLDEIASSFSFSREHIIRIFRKNYGITPHQYVLQSRIRIAMIMLKSGEKSIAEISDSLGFSDPHHFSHQFLRLVGVRPAVYRRHVSEK
ncbi:MAG: helix-turn-helix transcriptional regulator [Clostridia bacterium]|nr:helix-turn-helix transcriptional regulator [Clostridia bacterium]